MRELQKYSVELKAEAGKMVLEQGLTQQETGQRRESGRGCWPSSTKWTSCAAAAAAPR